MDFLGYCKPQTSNFLVAFGGRGYKVVYTKPSSNACSFEQVWLGFKSSSLMRLMKGTGTESAARDGSRESYSAMKKANLQRYVRTQHKHSYIFTSRQ